MAILKVSGTYRDATTQKQGVEGEMKIAVIGIVVLLELIAIADIILHGFNFDSMIFGLFIQTAVFVCVSMYLKNTQKEG